MRLFPCPRIPILVMMSLINGCGSETTTDPNRWADGGGTDPQVVPTRAEPLGKILQESFGTSGTIVPDYEESVKFLSSRKFPKSILS